MEASRTYRAVEVWRNERYSVQVRSRHGYENVAHFQNLLRPARCIRWWQDFRVNDAFRLTVKAADVHVGELAASLRAVLCYAPFGQFAECNFAAYLRPFRARRVLGFVTQGGVTALFALGYFLSPRWGCAVWGHTAYSAAG